MSTVIKMASMCAYGNGGKDSSGQSPQEEAVHENYSEDS